MIEIQDLMLMINKPYIKIIGTFLGGVVLRLFGMRLKDYLVNLFKSKEKKLGEIFLTNTEIRGKIQDIIIEIRGITRCNRVSLIEYHNGDESHNGLPFNYGSMTWEKTDSTTKDIKLMYQKVPISNISKMLIELHNKLDGFIKIDWAYSDEETKESIKYFGLETAYVFRITNHIKDGVIYVSFINDSVMDEQTIKLVKNSVLEIRELMKKMKRYK